MSVTIEPASRASDLGQYAAELDRTLAAPAESIAAGPSPGAPGSPAEPAGPEPLDPAALVPLVAILGTLATSRTGTKELTETERKQVAGALAPVCDKYAGDLFDQYAEEVALAAVLYVVTAPRLKEYRAHSKRDAASAELAAGKPEPEPTE